MNGLGSQQDAIFCRGFLSQEDRFSLNKALALEPHVCHFNVEKSKVSPRLVAVTKLWTVAIQLFKEAYRTHALFHYPAHIGGGVEAVFFLAAISSLLHVNIFFNMHSSL